MIVAIVAAIYSMIHGLIFIVKYASDDPEDFSFSAQKSLAGLFTSDAPKGCQPHQRKAIVGMVVSIVLVFAIMALRGLNL
jgi:hypothetical protein